jgi:hypothetical protein
MEWQIERVFEDLELHVRVGLVNSVVMDYEVRDMAVVGAVHGPSIKFRTADGDLTADPDQAEVLVKGTIKWDGCSHNTFGEGNGYLHACSRAEMVRFGELFNKLFDMAQELMSDSSGYLV